MDKAQYLLDRYNLYLQQPYPEGKPSFENQCVEHKIFSSISALYAAVHWDGFALYLGNEAEQVSFIVEALNSVGAVRTAEIVSKAIGIVFPNGLPSDSDQLKEEAYAVAFIENEELNSLDMEFYQYPENMTEILYDFLVDHPDEFGPTPICEAGGGSALGWSNVFYNDET